MSVLSVDSHVDHYVYLCWGTLLLRLKPEDDWSMTWKEVTVSV